MSKKIREYLQRKKTVFMGNFWPCLAIFVLSLIPVLYIWDSLAVGADMLIPLHSSGLEKYLYQWEDIQNGQYFSLNYYPLYFFYKLAEVIGLGIYQISSLLLFLLNIIAGLGIYKLIKLFHAKEKSYLYIISITFYLLSPALLNAWHYLYIYSFIPWFFYFIFKVVKNKKIRYSDLIWLNILLFFSSMDLPNPKYIFHICVFFVSIMFLSFFFRLINFKFFPQNLGKLIILILLSVYLFLPLGYFATHYSPESYGVHTKAGYKDTGKMMDFGSATLDKMFRLHHDGVMLNTPEQESYKNDALVGLLSYVFIILIIWNLFFVENKISKDRENYKFQLILFILILAYLFFASGPNPPLGFIYEYVVSNFAVFAFLRTTAGAVFFLSPLYAVLLFGFIKNIKKSQGLAVFLLLVSIGIVSYPLLNGIYYKNFNNVNPYTNRNQYGLKIPEEYFKIGNSIDAKKIDAKILFPQNDLAYINTMWGYFGPVIYSYLYASYNIGYNNIYSNIYNHNVGFILKDDSLMADKKSIDIKNIKNIKEIEKDGYLDLFSVNANNFLPHFYTPKNNIVSGGDVKNMPSIVSGPDYQIRSAIFFKKQNEGKDEILKQVQDDNQKTNNDQVLEFKKINPTKYRVMIHGASGQFPLVFSESFHDGWKAYLAKPDSYKVESYKVIKLEDAKNYKILDGNEEDQASKDELADYISKGWVTDLGNGKEKEITHLTWKNNKEELDYKEKYNIDFVSKNFQDTIQNDNLSKGNIFETWFKKSLPEENHLTANGYANSWWIDLNQVCQVESYKVESGEGSFCVKNPDGSYDFEMVVEFWPQRLFYVGLAISGLTLLGCLSYLWRMSRRRVYKVIKF